MLYVAITRARNHCTLSYASSRYRNGMTVTCSPSRFLRDIDLSYLHLSSGTSLAGNRPSFESYRSSYHSATRQNHEPQQRRLTPLSRATYTNRSVTPSSGATAPSSDATIHSASTLSEGMVIEHTRFGRGTILNIDTTQPEARITVNFDNTGERVLLLKFARFSITGQ